MISISCPGFCMTPFAEMMETIATHFNSWEIIAEGMHAMHEIEDDVMASKDSYDLKFTVHAPFSDLNIASLNHKIRVNAVGQVIDAIRISSELGIEIVTVHPGYKSPLGAYFPKKARELHKQSLIAMDKSGEEYGVTLALENLPKMWISLCHEPGEMSELIEGTNMKICLDVGHAHISHEIDGFLELKHSFANVHVHDNYGDIDRHLVLGQGSFDFKALFRELEGYKGDFVIESMNLKEGIESKAILTEMLKGV